jgi:hypothetical protein
MSSAALQLCPDAPVRASLPRADDAAGQARNPYPAVLFVGAGLGDDGFGDPLPRPRRPAGAPQLRATCSLIISQYCAGDRVTSSTPTSHSATSRSPAAAYRALTYPGAAHRNIAGPSGSGGASTASAAMARMAIAVHGLSPGPAHTDEHRRPPGLSTRANPAVAVATSGKNMYPNRTEILSNVASPKGRSSAPHTLVSKLVIPCASARRVACRASQPQGRPERHAPPARAGRRSAPAHPCPRRCRDAADQCRCPYARSSLHRPGRADP